MTTAVTHQVQTAIEDSIRESRIVSLDCIIDTQEFVALAEELLLASDDYTEQTIDGVLVREYWGTDDDNDAWRVHLHAAGA